MSHGLETLEQQSAPESTRGLFENYSDRKPTIIQTSKSTGKHRSLDSSGRPARQSFNPPPTASRTNNGNTKSHQRSRSASASDMGYFGAGIRRSNLGLQTLTEEGGFSHQQQPDNSSNKSSSFGGRVNSSSSTKRESVTMDSLKDMINTLKSIPPTASISTSSLSSFSSTTTTTTAMTNGGGKRFGHRKQQSLSSLPFGQQQSNIRRSYNDGNSTSDMHSVLQNKVQELRSISPPTTSTLVSPRPYSSSSSPSYRRFCNGPIGGGSGSNSGSDDDNTTGRDAALAEAEAKLVGSFTSLAGRRRSSDASIDAPSTLHKRSSLQQLATLSEESSGPLTDRLTSSRSSVLSKRTQFNKPLDLYSDASNKHKSSTGHSRRSSRNVDMDWRSSTPLVQPTSPRQTFQLVPFTPTRVNFARDDANPHQRRPLFIAHLPFSALTPLFQNRQLVRGMLRVNKRNRSDAYVYSEELDADIYIAGSRDRNRALEGDVVAVRLIDVDKVLQEKREKEEIKLVRGQARVRLPDEEDENEIIFGGDDEVEVVKPKFSGVVVAILERAQNQVFSGTLTLIRPNNKRAQEEKDQQLRNGGAPLYKKDAPRIVWFKATDKRVPLIAIPIEQTPDDFMENAEKYATRLFVGSIKRWPITSLHPFGTLEKELGSVFELATQTKAIYADNNVVDSDFSEVVYNCLPPQTFEASVDTSSSINKRRDFTSVRCFTIDPNGSNVLDDAFSIEKLDDDCYQIGVHISDVTYFIKPHSALDKEARARGVRVDLIHAHVPMVPEIMTEQMTNLSPGRIRFTFSVVWTINSQGKVLDTWYGKSTARSCAQLTTEEAQKVIDGDSLNTERLTDAHCRQDIENDIRLLASVTTELYNQRCQSGILTQLRDELVFDFDSDLSTLGVSVLTKPISTHRMVKELLLLANISVAQKISSRLPEQALLRRHASPVDRKIRALQNYCSRQLGVQVDIGSAGSLEKSIEAISDDKLRKLVSVIVLKTLKMPKYFCAGTYDIAKYSHYALNVPLFTHFTAPSRRFADILVHRQLEYALSSDVDTPFYLDRDTVQKLTQHCNVKKEASLYAREQSSLLFLGRHLDKLAKQNGKSVVYREATVVAVCDGHMDVMIGDLNMEKRVHLANLPVWRSDFDEAKQTLTMYWRKGVDTSTGIQRSWSITDDDDDDDDEGYLDEELLLEEMLQAGDAHQQQQDLDNLQSDTKEGTVAGLSILEQHAKKTTSYNVPLSNNPTHQKQNPEAAAAAAPPLPLNRPESTQSTSAKRASLVRSRLSDSTAYSTEQGYQTVKALDKIRVALVIDMVRTPPLIRILAVNPFA